MKNKLLLIAFILLGLSYGSCVAMDQIPGGPVIPGSAFVEILQISRKGVVSFVKWIKSRRSFDEEEVSAKEALDSVLRSVQSGGLNPGFFDGADGEENGREVILSYRPDRLLDLLSKRYEENRLKDGTPSE